MKAKHTSQTDDMDAAFASILETANDETAALVLNHLELSRRAIEWMMERETRNMAGDRYSHEKPHDGRFSRWGSNPGSVAVGGQKLRVDVPRVLDNVAQTTQSPEIYSTLRQMQQPPQHSMQLPDARARYAAVQGDARSSDRKNRSACRSRRSRKPSSSTAEGSSKRFSSGVLMMRPTMQAL